MFKTEIDSLCADFDNTLNRHSKLKERTPKLFFNSGFPANFCFFATFIFALFFFSSYFDELQMDSEVIIFDLHIVYPSAILKLLPLVSSKGGWISVIGLSMHCYAMYTTKARVILPDLLNIGAWIFMTGCHFVSRNVPDIYLIRFIVAGILCITTASVTFLPRKRKHRKRPNTVLSAFSVASTPISQCTTLDSESLLSSECTSPELSVRRSPKSVIASGMQRQHRFRNRGVTSTAKLSRNLGGHQSMEQGADNETENRRESFSLFSTNTSTTRRRSPISVVKKGILPESELQDEDVCTQEIDGIFGGLKLVCCISKFLFDSYPMLHWLTLFFGLTGLLQGEPLVHDSLIKSMGSFSDKLRSSFASHSRIEYVHRDVQKQLEGWIEVHSHDFYETTQEFQNSIQTFFDNRSKAIKRIVASAESETQALIYSSHRLVDDVECDRFRQLISEQNLRTHQPRTQKKSLVSGVHVTVESFVCDSSVIRDFTWTHSPRILKTLKNNYDSGLAMSRQYIGTYSGLSRVFPSFRWLVEPESITFDLFDPRYRQWFIGAESSPKDVLFLIDFSGSVKGQTQHLTKMTILHVLATLNPNDYFNAVWYSSRHELVLKHCFDGFLPATTRNKRMFQNQLEKIEERDQALLSPALNHTLNMFRQGQLNASDFLRETMGKGSGGHKIIMIFTDGIEEWPIDLVQREKDAAGDIVRVFGFSMGYGTGELPILDYISCNTGATYSIVDSIADVKHQSRSYLTALSEVLALSYKDKDSAQERPITWSPPYMDTQGIGPVITLSMPILNMMVNGTNGFIGAAGVDILFTELAELLPNNEQIYSFIIDNNGIVMYHPKLMTPTREVYSVRRTACYDTRVPPRKGGRIQFGGSDERVLKLMGLVDSIQTTDILEIESPTEQFRNFRQAMIDKSCGEVVDDGPFEYRCSIIEGTPLVVGYVGRKDDSVLSLKYTSKKPSLPFKDLVGFYVPKRELCGDHLDSYGDLDRLDAYLSNQERCAENRRIPYAFTNILTSWSLTWPDLEENQTCATSALPDETFSSLHTSSFVFTQRKISAFYPRCNFELVKPILTELGPPLSTENRIPKSRDRNRLETFVLEGSFIAKENIRDASHDKFLATVGVQWQSQFVNDLWYNLTHEDNGWEECFRKGKECHLLTSNGFVVASSASKLGDLAHVDSFLFEELSNRGHLKSSAWVDHQKYCKPDDANSYSISTSTSASLRSPLRTLAKGLLSTLHTFLWILLDVCIRSSDGQPVMVGNICKFSKIKHLEQCSMEYTKHTLDLAKPISVTIHHENCTRSATVVPFGGITMSLLLVEGLCEENETFKGIDPFAPRRIPDCQLASPLYRKRRPDLDYSRNHPDENPRDCPASSSNASYSVLLTVLCIAGSFLSRVVS
ncbi:hypothetical protein QR680_001427 [Steinernema hermaphroditum]|uniref:VWFA domain-containing protein n=1 Tax=Steinernema hermaphroditum TaxID=289476 RepID=A0AA39H082_9BILA|nr:hypothetical protein QR680_001427 [Steinernema hermaphroditum]